MASISLEISFFFEILIYLQAEVGARGNWALGTTDGCCMLTTESIAASAAWFRRADLLPT